MLTQIWRISNY